MPITSGQGGADGRCAAASSRSSPRSSPTACRARTTLGVAREIEARGARRRRRARDDRRCSTARCASASTTPALDGSPTRDDVAKCSARDLPLAAARGGDGATTVAATAHLAAQAGIGAVRDRRPRRRAPRGARDLGRVGRPGRARPHADLRRLRRREVDPRRRRHARAAGDARRRPSLGYRHRPLPGLLPDRLRPPVPVAARLAARRSPTSLAAAHALGARRGALLVANPLPRRRAARPRAARPRARRGAGRAGARGRRAGKDVTPFLLAALPRARPAARACGRTSRSCCANAGARRGRSPPR